MLPRRGGSTTGLVRDDRSAEHSPCSADEAITRAAAGLRRILDEHGPDAIALYVSGQMTIEAQYLANKLAKGFIGTNQIESNSRLCMASAGAGYKLSLGADGPPGSYDDLDHADVFLVIGSNMADCHPILFLRLLDRVQAGRQADRRRPAAHGDGRARPTCTSRCAPGTDLALLNGLLHLLVDGRPDRRRLHRRAHRRAGTTWRRCSPTHPPDVVAAATGIAEADLRARRRR